jgi:gas vesicle protein
MGKTRGSILGGVIGAAAGVVLAPRHGESRREALARLRLAARPGRDALRAFSGTPCAAEARTSVSGQGGASGELAPPAGREGDEHG